MSQPPPLALPVHSTGDELAAFIIAICAIVLAIYLVVFRAR